MGVYGDLHVQLSTVVTFSKMFCFINLLKTCTQFLKYWESWPGIWSSFRPKWQSSEATVKNKKQRNLHQNQNKSMAGARSPKVVGESVHQFWESPLKTVSYSLHTTHWKSHCIALLITKCRFARVLPQDVNKTALELAGGAFLCFW